MSKRYQKIAIALCCGVVMSYGSPGDNIHNLNDITVKGEAITDEQQPVSVTTLDSEAIDKLYLQRPEEILNEVPGAEAGNYNQGGVANTFMLRGFSNGGHGGDAAVFIDGITLNEGESHADGYADMNVLIPLEIDHAEIFKGPSSALYGNFARGGILAFNTKKGGEYNKLRMEYGTFNTFNTQGAFGIKLNDRVHNNTAVQYFHTDGYQDNTDWLRGNLATRFSFKINDDLDMALSLRAHGSEWKGAGYIPEDQFEDRDEAKKQAVNAENDGGSKRFYTERFDIGYSISNQLKVLGWVYGTQQDFTRFAKFGYGKDGQTERNYDRKVFGSGASVNYQGSAGAFPFAAVSGVEFFKETTDWYRWSTSNRVRSSMMEERTFEISTFSSFAQADIELTRFFRPMIAVRADNFGGEYENRDPESDPFTQTMNDYTAISPKAGFSSRIIEPLDLRFSYSQGYALPDGEAKYDPAFSVDPVDIRQFEAGLNFKLDKWITADFTAYILDTDNEIQEVTPNSNEYKNIGETRRMGLEFSASVSPVDGLDLFGDIGVTKSEVVENQDTTLIGKKVTGVPKYIGNVGMRYTLPFGLGFGLKYRKVGPYKLDDLNLTSYKGYNVLNGDIHYTISGDGATKYRFFLSVDNIADNHYSQSVWEGFDTMNYAVSSPRTFTGGVQIDW